MLSSSHVTLCRNASHNHSYNTVTKEPRRGGCVQGMVP